MPKTTLEKVMARRRTLAKAHPSWDNAKLLSEAWKPYKGKSVSGVSRKRPKKKATKSVGRVKKKAAPRRKKISGTSRTNKKVAGIGAVKQQAREAERVLKDRLGKAMVSQYEATTKPAKKKAAKKVSEIKTQITHVKRIINKKS